MRGDQRHGEHAAQDGSSLATRHWVHEHVIMPFSSSKVMQPSVDHQPPWSDAFHQRHSTMVVQPASVRLVGLPMHPWESSLALGVLTRLMLKGLHR